MKYKVEDGFPYYISLLGDRNFKQQFLLRDNIILLESLSEENANYRYAQNKWNIKQIIGHISDHERIMIYRVLRFSRKDTTQLLGYDQDNFVYNSNFNDLTFQKLLEDYKNVRNASNSFIANLSASQLAFKVQAWKFELTIEDFLKATIGHEIHHFNVVKEKYLNLGNL